MKLISEFQTHQKTLFGLALVAGLQPQCGIRAIDYCHDGGTTITFHLLRISSAEIELRPLRRWSLRCGRYVAMLRSKSTRNHVGGIYFSDVFLCRNALHLANRLTRTRDSGVEMEDSVDTLSLLPPSHKRSRAAWLC